MFGKTRLVEVQVEQMGGGSSAGWRSRPAHEEVQLHELQERSGGSALTLRSNYPSAPGWTPLQFGRTPKVAKFGPNLAKLGASLVNTCPLWANAGPQVGKT